MGIQDVGLVFKKSIEKFSVKGYLDLYFGGDMDRRRSMIGYVFTIGGNIVS